MSDYRYPDPKMTPATRLDIAVHARHQPTALVPEPVEDWYPGWLFHWRQRVADDGWEGYVEYTTGPGSNHVAWLDESRIRKDEPDQERDAPTT